VHPPGAGKFTSLRVLCKKLNGIKFKDGIETVAEINSAA
jgi:hypothetical protein